MMSTTQDSFGSASHASTSSGEDHGNFETHAGSRSAYDSATSELKNFVADVEDLVERVANVKGSDIERVRLKVQHALQRAKARLADASANARNEAGKFARSTDSYVRESPWQSVGMAALLGMAVGVLVSRRS